MEKKREFCRYCGAGIGVYRREGEGTCMVCDPTPLPEMLKRQTERAILKAPEEQEDDPFINAIDPYR